jgi:hypothetical protein
MEDIVIRLFTQMKSREGGGKMEKMMMPEHNKFNAK